MSLTILDSTTETAYFREFVRREEERKSDLAGREKGRSIFISVGSELLRMAIAKI